MARFLIMCRSLTYAQRAVRVLERAGLNVTIVKAPQELTAGGCGYAVYLNRDLRRALELLRAQKIPYGKLYELRDTGYTEVRDDLL